MDEIKKVYIDPRYKTNDSVSNSGFKFELKEALDLPDNTVCFSMIPVFPIHGIR